MEVIDLSGKWICSSPDGSIRKEVSLPGSSCEFQIGKKQEYYEEYTKETVRAPRERYEYIGELIYERDIDIPDTMADKNIVFFFERINIASKLFIDDVQIGRGVVELTTPHTYMLTNRHNCEGKPLFEDIAGRHHIKLVIDNTNFLNLGDMGSGYSVDTQGYWNGCIGRMELQAYPVNYIERIAAFPRANGVELRTVLATCHHMPMQIEKGRLKYSLVRPDGKLCKLYEGAQDIELFATRQTVHHFLTLDKEDIILWDEFSTGLYEIRVELECESCKDTCTDHFGYRHICVRGKRFMLNDRPLSLRGTINCAQYPLTGYPPMDEETWTKHFATFKDHGLNHVRFHAWCPPEAAFLAADKLGLYLSVEMPLWLNWDVTPMEFGDDEWHEMYFRTEALRMSQTFGNHPSFCFFSNGNENMGDFSMLETIIQETKAVDDRRVYTMTSNFDHPKSPYEDYLCAFEIYHRRARIQTLHDTVAEHTRLNYDVMAREVPVPFTSFEVGQYCVYPNVDECERYTGNIMPVNLDIIRKMMKEHGVYHKLRDYIMASGDLAAKLYKEDIEAVLRTKGMGGFQLLSLVDYTGQSTATVGLLNIFHENKGVISPEEFKSFCCEVVPLFQADRIFKNSDVLEATLSLYDYGKEKISCPEYELRFMCKGKEIYSNNYKATDDTEDHEVNITIPLDFVNENSFIEVSLSVGTYTNTYRIFVYMENQPAVDEKLLVRTPEELKEAISQGRSVIALRGAYDEEQYKNRFVPVFWSPVHFPSSAPCGAFIKENHAALHKFPTGKYLDYQWKSILDNSISLDISNREEVDIIMEMVPNFVDNVPKSPLFAYNEGSSRIVFCGFDIEEDSLTSKALAYSLCEYLKVE